MLAIINSKLISFLATHASVTAKKDDFTQLTLADIREIAIPKPLNEQNEQITSLVEQLLLEKPAKGSILDNSLDQLIYQIYGLTAEEIALIESHY